MAVEKGEKKTKNVFKRKMRTLGCKEYDVMRYSMTVNGWAPTSQKFTLHAYHYVWGGNAQ